LLEKVITVTEENTIQRQKMHEEAMARQDRLLDTDYLISLKN